MSLVIFSHANSFPASTYGIMFKSLRARGYAVRAPEMLAHDPRYPVTSNWPHLVQQVADFASAETTRAPRERSRNWTGDMLTATLVSFGQSTASWQARCSTHSPIEMISPVSSAIGTNSAGEM